MHIVRVGSRRPHLQDGAMSIFEVCLQHGAKLEMEWIPRTSNEKADYISRIIDHDDWQINPVVFRLDCLWGPHTYDRFASPHNSQLPRFDNKFWNPLCSAVDTLRRPGLVMSIGGCHLLTLPAVLFVMRKVVLLVACSYCLRGGQHLLASYLPRWYPLSFIYSGLDYDIFCAAIGHTGSCRTLVLETHCMRKATS